MSWGLLITPQHAGLADFQCVQCTLESVHQVSQRLGSPHADGHAVSWGEEPAGPRACRSMVTHSAT